MDNDRLIIVFRLSYEMCLVFSLSDREYLDISIVKYNIPGIFPCSK